MGAGGREWGAKAGDPSSLSCPTDGLYEIGGLLPVWAVVVIVGTALASVTFFATSNREPPRLHWVRIGGRWWPGCVFIYFLCMSGLQVYLCTMCMPDTLRDQQGVLGPLEQELPLVMGH